jgi:hypothetical protein
MNISINRCVAINKNNKRCRAKTKNNELFCCESHCPINKELVTDGCFICNENIEKTTEIIYFNCKHAFHKPCYNEWLEYSTYDTPICLICRDIVVKNKLPEKKQKKLNIISNITPLLQINSELNKNNIFY